MNEGIELYVYSYANPSQLLDVIIGRVDPRYLDELGTCAGSFKVSTSDPQIIAQPELLDYRNVVKFKVDGVFRGAFIIRSKKTVLIGEGEFKDEFYDVSGPGLLAWSEDATVLPQDGLGLHSPEERWFNFAAEQGGWYNVAQWPLSTSAGEMKQRSWWSWEGSPVHEWPEGAMKVNWIWDRAQAEATPRPSTPVGTAYFRHEFDTTEALNIVMYLLADDFAELFIDGELVGSYEWADKVLEIPMILTSGHHVIGIRATNNGGPAGVAFIMYGVNTTTATKYIMRYTGTSAFPESTWRVRSYPAKPPTPSPGQIMLQLLDEAETRNIWMAGWLVPNFTATYDSNGVLWPDDVMIEWSFKVGEKYSQILDKFRELGIHVWVDPTTLQLNMAMTQGTNRTVDPGAVTFELGKNLRRAQSEGQALIKNMMNIKTTDGWLRIGDNQPSTTKYGAIEETTELNTTFETAATIAEALFASRGDPEEAAVYDVTSSHEVPYVDYFLGDLVLAPNEKGLRVARRIVSISTEELPNGRPRFTLEFDVISRSQAEQLNRKINKALGGGGSLGGSASTGGVSKAVNGPIVSQPTSPVPIETPLAPTGLTITSTGAWNASGTVPLATATVSWSPVNLTTDGNEMVASAYRVWMRDTSSSTNPWLIMTEVTTTSVTLGNLIPGRVYAFKVQALGSSTASIDSATVNHTMASPNTAMAAPTVPVLTTSRSLLDIKWDGKLTGNVDPPPQFRYVYAKVATSSGGTYTRMGTVLQKGGGTITISGLTAGTAYWVRLVAVDGLGVISADSPTATTTVVGINLGSLDADVQAAIDAAAAVGQAAEDEFDAFYATDFLDLDTLVTNIDTVDIPGLADGTLIVNNAIGTRHVQTNSMFAQHVVIGSIQNLIPNGMGEAKADVAWSRDLTWDTTKKPDGMAGSFKSTKGQGTLASPGGPEVFWDVEPGTEYLMEIWTMADVPNSRLFIELRNQDGAHASTNVVPEGYTYADDSWASGAYPFSNGIVPVEWTRFTSLVKVNATTTKMRIGSLYFNHLNGTERNAQVWLLLRLRPRNGAELMVDGSVLARHFGAKQIDTIHMRAQSVDAEIVKLKSLTGDHMAFRSMTGDVLQLGTLEVGHVNDTFGRDLVIDENERIIFAVGQAEAAADAAGVASQAVEDMKMYYSFGPTGAEISTPTSPLSIWLQNDRISFMQGGQSGVELSAWTAGQMVVNEFVGTTVTFGNHQLTEYPGGSVMRFVG